MLQLGHGFDEQQVGPRLGILLGALHGGVKAMHGGGVGAGHDEQVLVAPCIARGLDLANHLAGLHHVLAAEVPASLRRNLVFELDAVGARALQGAHCVVGVEGIAKAGVGVHDQRQLHGVADAGGVVGDVGEAHEGLVGQAEPHVGNASAGDVNGLEAQVCHHAGREGVERAGHDDAAAGMGQGLELLFGVHGISIKMLLN
jgi:hypothetical protein